MLIGKAKCTNQTDALILGTREAVADDDGPPNDAVNTAFEDVWQAHADCGTGRLRKTNWLHWADTILSQGYGGIGRAEIKATASERESCRVESV